VDYQRDRDALRRWARELRAARGSDLSSSAATLQFIATGTAESLVAVALERADRGSFGYCCEAPGHGFPVSVVRARPQAVIDAMLAGEVRPMDALAAIRHTRDAAGVDAIVRSIPGDRLRAALEAADSPWDWLPWGMCPDPSTLARAPNFDLTAVVAEEFDRAWSPYERSLPLRVALRDPSARAALSLAVNTATAERNERCCWVRIPALLSLSRALVDEQPTAIVEAMDAIEAMGAWVWRADSEEEPPRVFDLRESIARMCVYFGHSTLAVRWLREVLREPLQRTFETRWVVIAAHRTTIDAVLATLTAEQRHGLEDQTFAALDRRDASVSEWISLARWSRPDVAAQCLDRAWRRFEAIEEPFDADELPPASMTRWLSLCARRLRQWNARMRASRVDADRTAGDDVSRLDWFSPAHPAAVAAALPVVRDEILPLYRARAQHALRWLHRANGCFDPEVERALANENADRAQAGRARSTPVDPESKRYRVEPQVTNQEHPLIDALSPLFERCSIKDRARWVDALVDNVPLAIELDRKLVDDAQRRRLIARTVESLSMTARVLERRSRFSDDDELYAACVDRWIERGCPCDPRSTTLATIRAYFRAPGRDRARHRWKLSPSELRAQLWQQVEARSFDWLIDPGADWIHRTLRAREDNALRAALATQAIEAAWRNSASRELVLVEALRTWLAYADEATIEAAIERFPSWLCDVEFAAVTLAHGLRATTALSRQRAPNAAMTARRAAQWTLMAEHASADAATIDVHPTIRALSDDWDALVRSLRDDPVWSAQRAIFDDTDQLFAEARPWANDSPYVPDGSIESLRRRLEAGEEIGCSDAIVALANEAPALLVTFGDQLVARVLDEHADG
jgi:hypothetical protein